MRASFSYLAITEKRTYIYLEWMEDISTHIRSTVDEQIRICWVLAQEKL